MSAVRQTRRIVRTTFTLGEYEIREAIRLLIARETDGEELGLLVSTELRLGRELDTADTIEVVFERGEEE